jgi:hypothetical protein
MQQSPQALRHSHLLSAGARVEVRCSFDGAWARGFEVTESVITPMGTPAYRLRRLSDGAVLPVLFPGEDVLPVR